MVYKDLDNDFSIRSHRKKKRNTHKHSRSVFLYTFDCFVVAAAAAILKVVCMCFVGKIKNKRVKDHRHINRLLYSLSEMNRFSFGELMQNTIRTRHIHESGINCIEKENFGSFERSDEFKSPLVSLALLHSPRVSMRKCIRTLWNPPNLKPSSIYYSMRARSLFKKLKVFKLELVFHVNGCVSFRS